MPRHSSSISEQYSSHSAEKSTTHVAPKRTNRVRKFSRLQSLETIVEAVETDGCVVIEDFINPQISQRVQSAEDADIEGIDTELEEDVQATTVDVNSLIRESLVADPLFQSLSSQFLTLETTSWKDKQIQTNTTNPSISSSTTLDVNSAATSPQASTFHRADSVYHTQHHGTSRYEYKSRRDTSLGLFVPELNSLSETINIETIPGSHLWDDSKPNLSNGVQNVRLAAGEALILLGSLYHKTQDAKSSPAPPKMSRVDSAMTKEKLVHEIWMCSGVYRPSANVMMDENES